MKLYYLNVNDLKENHIEKVKNILPLRYEKAMKYESKSHTLQKIGGGILMLEVFNNLKEERIKYNEFNRPYIENEDDFSISNSNDLVCLIKDNRYLGVDIEKIDESKYKKMDVMFTSKEKNWIEKKPLERTFIVWTIKEALLKATKTGINKKMHSIDIMHLINNGSMLYEGNIYYYKSFQIDDYVGSIVSLNKIECLNLEKIL